MTCRIIDMRHKEVINVKDGTRIGCVCDVEIDTADARVIAIVIYGRLRCFGLLGREDDIIIKWQDIQVIGDDTILVTYNNYCRTKKRGRGFGGFFGN
ncbi:YlmC/YmxH family sporulation protein [Caproiciproducens sp.]